VTDQTGIEPPREPVAPPQLVFPLTVATPPPSRAPMIVALIGGFFIVAIVIAAAAYILSATFARAVDSNDLGAAERVVNDLDAAYQDADCDAFESLTSEDARDDILGESYDCDAFEAAAAALTDGGDYVYSVRITDSRKRGELITVSTDEAYGSAAPTGYTYVLERDGDRWVVTAYGED
jgi:hypothetical protein